MRSSKVAVAVVAVAVIVAAGVLVSIRLLGGDPVQTGNDAAHGATVIRYDVRSRYVGRTLAQVAAVPPGRRRARPLLVFLHGRGADGAESNANAPFFAALAALGDRAPVVVFPSGADHSYWHARRSGDWARYVLDEVIPAAVHRLHADRRRIALGGISITCASTPAHSRPADGRTTARDLENWFPRCHRAA